VTLAVENLAFGYPGRRLGADITFSVGPGDVLCLLGPNGGGKTTLFKTLLGLLRRHGGTVRIDGADIAGWPRRRIAHAIAYVPQAHVAYFPFRVLDAVVMGRTAHLGVFSTPRRADYVTAEAALASLGIDHLAGRSYTEISGGERQLCLVARALAQDARYIVMDEPTASLDFGNQVHVLQRIRGLAEAGLGVLFSSHDPDHAFLYADRAALLHQGSLLRLAPPREAITPETLRALYGIEVAVVDVASPKVTVSIPVREPGALKSP
jgi:iron complex transport system ATP-binding protein